MNSTNLDEAMHIKTAGLITGRADMWYSAERPLETVLYCGAPQGPYAPSAAPEWMRTMAVCLAGIVTADDDLPQLETGLLIYRTKPAIGWIVDAGSVLVDKAGTIYAYQVVLTMVARVDFCYLTKTVSSLDVGHMLEQTLPNMLTAVFLRWHKGASVERLRWRWPPYPCASPTEHFASALMDYVPGTQPKHPDERWILNFGRNVVVNSFASSDPQRSIPDWAHLTSMEQIRWPE